MRAFPDRYRYFSPTPMTKFRSVSSELRDREPPQKETDMSFCLVPSGAPGVWVCRTERGTFDVAAESRAEAYVHAACTVHNCPLPWRDNR